MSIRNAIYTHCQMNENPCSNREIHELFEHGSELENTTNEPCIICMTLYTESVADRTNHFADVFVREKRCVRLRRCDNVMAFESTQPTPFCLEKYSVRTLTI